MTTMDDAWTEFDRAVKFDEKARELRTQGPEKERLAGTAQRASDRALDKAVHLESIALSEAA